MSILPRSAAALCVVLMTWASLAARAQGDAPVYVNPEQGFAIRPDASWKREEAATGEAFSVVFWPESRGRAVQVSVRVQPATSETHPRAIRALLLKSLAGRPGYGEPQLEEHALAGRKTPAFSLDTVSAGRTYRIRQAFLVTHGLRYVLECLAPEEEFATWWPAFEEVWSSFRFVAIAAGSENALHALAARCGSELEWASSWEEAAARAKGEKKLVLVTVKLLPNFPVADHTRTSLLMDPDVVPLVQHRFVPLAFWSGMDAPFVAEDSSYGVSPSAFGTSVLVVTPDGDVVGDTAVIQPTAFDAFLRQELAERPEFDGAPTPEERQGLDLAEWHLERGELEAALALSASDASVRGCRIEAAVLRRRRQGAPAIAELAAAYAASDTAGRADVVADSAWVYARMGAFQRAEDCLTTLLASLPAHPRIPEAKWLLGVCRFRTRGQAGAGRVWKELAAAHPESRWAWRAAAALTSSLFRKGGDARFMWPSEAALESVGRSEAEPSPAKRARQAEAAAIAYLLRVQREDGSWASPGEAASAPTARPRPTTVAKTAICARSLIPARGQADVRAALDRALTWLLAARQSWKEHPPQVAYMDYRPWSTAFELWFYADALRARVGDADELRLMAAQLVSELRDLQRSNGGWSYALDGPDGRKQSISFMTAAVSCALLEAREAEIPVPNTVLKRAHDCLDQARGPKDTFGYFVWGAEESGDTPVPGAAGRGPACMLALMGGGRAETKDLLKVLDLFLAWRHTYAKEQGKTLMHCGADGQGSHYLLFDYMFAARAITRLPKQKRRRYREAILELLLGARYEDGSFVDNPVNGSHYGTGMALIALQQLRSGR